MFVASRCVFVLFATLSVVAAQEVCASDDLLCSGDVAALSLLQKKATQMKASKAVTTDMPGFMTPAAMMSAACKKQCAGTLCQDPNNGMNQMLSCMQSCEIRMHGESEAACDANCDRNGQSGCSLSTHGFTANMCGYCSDWKAGTQSQKDQFVNNDDCKKGCHVKTPCEEQCADTLCPDPEVGMNQILSCMQTCTMRMKGQQPETCAGQCDRNGQSGCSLTAEGFTANMCAYCSDWKTATEPQRKQMVDNADCRKGCDVGKLSRCQIQCAGTLCQDPKVGMNQQLSCMQACEMRMRGEDEIECGYRCNRNGQSGCSLTADGFQANMCSYCDDWKSGTQEQKNLFVSNEDCLKGCSVDVPPSVDVPALE